MPGADVSAVTVALIEQIAGAIRNALGAEIDVYPGAGAPEGADPLNRAFGAVVRALLADDGVLMGHLSTAATRTLHQIAVRRLAAEGWDAVQVKTLIEQEPGAPDDWLIFLILSARSQIEPLLDPDQA